MFPIFDSIENSISGYMQLIIIYKHTLFVCLYISGNILLMSKSF